MKKISLLLLSLLIVSATLPRAVAEKNLETPSEKAVKPDFSQLILEEFKIDDVDMDLLDVGKEITNSPLSDLKMSTAVTYKLFNSAKKTTHLNMTK